MLFPENEINYNWKVYLIGLNNVLISVLNKIFDYGGVVHSYIIIGTVILY